MFVSNCSKMISTCVTAPALISTHPDKNNNLYSTHWIIVNQLKSMMVMVDYNRASPVYSTFVSNRTPNTCSQLQQRNMVMYLVTIIAKILCAASLNATLKKNIEKHLLPQFVNTIQVICLQNVYIYCHSLSIQYK